MLASLSEMTLNVLFWRIHVSLEALLEFAEPSHQNGAQKETTAQFKNRYHPYITWVWAKFRTSYRSCLAKKKIYYSPTLQADSGFARLRIKQLSLRFLPIVAIVHPSTIHNLG
jgi:hypothetical protein